MHVRLLPRGLTAARRIVGATVLVGALSAGALSPGTASAQSSLPVNRDFATASLSTFTSPTVPPPGANNWSSRPTTQHPYP
jgi:hypothetical protein